MNKRKSQTALSRVRGAGFTTSGLFPLNRKLPRPAANPFYSLHTAAAFNEIIRRCTFSRLGKLLRVALLALPLGLAATAAHAQSQSVIFEEYGYLSNPFETREGASTIELIVTTNPAPQGTLTVSYGIGGPHFNDTTPADPADYTDVSGGEVMIAAGMSRTTVMLAIIDDDQIEPTSESFTVSLEDVEAATQADSAYHIPLGGSTRVRVIIREGVCDRTESVSTVIATMSGVDDCADVDDADLSAIADPFIVKVDASVASPRQGDFWGLVKVRLLDMSTPVGSVSGGSLSENMFDGLDGLGQLVLSELGITEIPDGVFSGLGSLTTLSLQNNHLTDLGAGKFSDLNTSLQFLSLSHNPQLAGISSDAFSGLEQLRTLRLHGTGLRSLPDNLFVGLALDDLRLPNRVELPLQFEVVDAASASIPAKIRVSLRPGAPFDLTIKLSTDNATVSSPQVLIARGTTESMAFTVQPVDPGLEASVGFAAAPAVPGDSTVQFDFSATFAIPAAGSAPSRVAIVSTPATDGVYAAGETIIVEVTFSSVVAVTPSTDGPTLALGIGADVREMTFADASTDTLRFEYTVSDQDYGADGISIGQDALMLGGAVINDGNGEPARLELGAREIMNALGHGVSGRQLSLSLALETESVLTGSFSTVTLTLSDDAGVLTNADVVEVSLTPGDGLEAPGTVTLTNESLSTKFRVSVSTDADFSLSSLTASVAQAVQDLISARIASAELSVPIDPRVFRIEFVPPEVTVKAGGPSVPVEIRLVEEVGSLTEEESPLIVYLQTCGPFSGRTDPIESSPSGPQFFPDTKVITLDISARDGADFITHSVRTWELEPCPSNTQFTPAEGENQHLNTQIRHTSLRVTVQQREIAVEFEPSSIRLERGGVAAEETSETVTLALGAGSELRNNDHLMFDLSTTGGLQVVSPTGPVRLDLDNSTVAVVVQADADSSSGEVIATLDTRTTRSRYGSATVTASTSLTVGVVRRVEMTFSRNGSPNIATVVAGGTTDVTVTTSPMLEADEEAWVTLNLNPDLRIEDASLALTGGNQLMLSEENRYATVRITTSIPELDLSEGAWLSGTGVNVALAPGAPLRVVSRRAREVDVALVPSLVEVEQGGVAVLSVTTEPRLGTGQTTTVTLAIAPNDKGLSFADDTFSTTVELVGGLDNPSSKVGVTVKALLNAIKGDEAQVTSVSTYSTEVAVSTDSEQSQATLRVVLPQATVGFTPAGGVVGDAFTLALGSSKSVTLGLTDFTLSGDREVPLEVTVVGEGLTLEDGGTSLMLSLTTAQMTIPVTVLASGDAESVGRLEVQAFDGVRLPPGMDPAVLAVEVLQPPVTLRFDPETTVTVEFGPDGGAKFAVMADPQLIADRAATVTLSVSTAGFRFTGDAQQHQVVLTSANEQEMVSVFATAPASVGSTAAVSATVETTAGASFVTPLPGLTLEVVPLSLGTKLRIRVFLEGALE